MPARWTDLLSLLVLQGLLLATLPPVLGLLVAVAVALIVYLVAADQRQRKPPPSVPPESDVEKRLLAQQERLIARNRELVAELDEWEHKVGHSLRPSRSPSPQPQLTSSTTSPKRRTTRATSSMRQPLPR